MKIVFMGTPEFAVPSLDILVKNSYEISAVVTIPDKRQGRGLKISESAVKKYSLEKNLNILQPKKLKDENFINELKALSPDLFVIVAFRILPQEVFTIPKLGSFNLHASLLPKYRGAAPINWAIINGETVTGVTTFFLKEIVDTGNIILQKETDIGENETAGSLHDKLSFLGAETVLETVKMIESGNVQTFSQDDSLTSPAPKIFHDDCRISWERDVKHIHDFIRGLSPYPGAFTFLNGKMLKITMGKVYNGIPDEGHQIEEVFIHGKKFIVNTGAGFYEILKLKPEGKKEMSAVDFINGLPPDVREGKIIFE